MRQQLPSGLAEHVNAVRAAAVATEAANRMEYEPSASTGLLYEVGAINGTANGAGGPGTSSELGYDHVLVQRVVGLVVPISFGLIFVLGFFGNSLVVVVVACNQSMRSVTNVLIINLAIADLLFVIFCIPFTATDFVLPYWPFGNIWCKVVQYLIIVTACASVYTLVLMSLDRYLAVVHPIRSMRIRTEVNAFIAIWIVWIVILTSSIPVFIIHGEYRQPVEGSGALANNSVALEQSFTEAGYEYLQRLRNGSDSLGNRSRVLEVEPYAEEQTSCRILVDDDKLYFQVTFFLVSYVVPLALIVGLYVCMLLRLWQGERPKSAKSRRDRKRVSRLVFVVVGVFAISWCPIQVVLVFKSLDMYPLSTFTIMLQIASHVLAYANSCVNPILYAFLSENFRNAFRKFIYCRNHRRLDQHQQQLARAQTRTTRAPSSGHIL